MGRKQFETVVANAPKEYLAMVDLSRTLTTGIGSTNTIYLYAPAGYIGEVQGIYLHKPFPAGAISGTHLVEFGYPTLTRAYGKSTFNKNIRWVFSYWDEADSKQAPPSTQTQMSALQNLVFDDVAGLYFAIRNDTNVADTDSALLLRVMVKYRQVAK
jgi:hypothetical protein